MKIKMLEDAHHAISGGVSQSFKKGSVVEVPKATADKLIDRKVASATNEAVTKQEKS